MTSCYAHICGGTYNVNCPACRGDVPPASLPPSEELRRLVEKFSAARTCARWQGPARGAELPCDKVQGNQPENYCPSCTIRWLLAALSSLSGTLAATGEPLLIDGWTPRYILDEAISMVSQSGNQDLANRLGELHNRIEGKTLWPAASPPDERSEPPTYTREAFEHDRFGTAGPIDAERGPQTEEPMTPEDIARDWKLRGF